MGLTRDLDDSHKISTFIPDLNAISASNKDILRVVVAEDSSRDARQRIGKDALVGQEWPAEPLDDVECVYGSRSVVD